MPGYSPALNAARSQNIRKALAARHKPVTDAEYLSRYFAKTSVDERGCWIWQGFKHKRGYGEASYRGKAWRIHRLVLFLTKGAIPADWDACHSCDNPSCINPKHLFGGPRSVNVDDMRRKKRGNHQKKDACIHGHPFDAENTRICKRGFRHCKRCELIKQRMYAGWSEDEAISTPPVPPHVRTARRHFGKRVESSEEESR